MSLILLSLAAFALAATAGIAAAHYLCRDLAPLPDGPSPGTPRPAVVIAVAALLGAVACARGLPVPYLAVFALSCAVLAGIWYADVARGIIPDLFTLVPLAAVAVAAALSGRWDVLASALVTAAPFALIGAVSRGRGLGWGDVKLAALGGALIGLQNALLAFAVASLVAIVVTRVRRVPSGTPIAFGPYLVLGIAIPLALSAGR